MKQTDFLNDPRMQQLSPEKKALICEYVDKSKGLPPEKALPLLMQTNLKMKSLGLYFSADETNLMFDIMSADMSVTEKTKLEALKKLLHK